MNQSPKSHSPLKLVTKKGCLVYFFGAGSLFMTPYLLSAPQGSGIIVFLLGGLLGFMGLGLLFGKEIVEFDPAQDQVRYYRTLFISYSEKLGRLSDYQQVEVGLADPSNDIWVCFLKGAEEPFRLSTGSESDMRQTARTVSEYLGLKKEA